MRDNVLARRYFLALATAGLALIATGCGAVEVSKLPVQRDFSDCNGFTMNNDVSTVDCPEGELRMHVSQPQVSAIHLAPFRFDPTTAGLAVEADVRHPKGSGAYGLGCAVTEADEPGRGYLFVVVHGDPALQGTASIIRLDSGYDATTQSVESLGSKRNAARPQGPHRLRAVCKNTADGSAQLSMSIDGNVIVTARDRKGMGRYTAALAVEIASAPNTEARFDNLGADLPDAREAEKEEH